MAIRIGLVAPDANRLARDCRRFRRGWGSSQGGILHSVAADGSVRVIGAEIEPRLLAAMATIQEVELGVD
ncbi:hypothetical protein [Botrimarina sp.]|uniref:hypothetical protein n=1 Tax=Botrimarina sp. TaxID=2795802 RepID=UPI0032ED36BA